MKALKAHRRYDQEQEDLRYKARLKAEEEKLAKMTPEDRDAYLKEQKKRVNKALSFLSVPQMFEGPYSKL